MIFLLLKIKTYIVNLPQPATVLYKEQILTQMDDLQYDEDTLDDSMSLAESGMESIITSQTPTAYQEENAARSSPLFTNGLFTETVLSDTKKLIKCIVNIERCK